MNDATPTGDGPISTQPEGNPDFGMPGDSPLADAPLPEAPDLAPDSTEPGDDETAPPPADDVPDESPPLPGETATDDLFTAEPAEEPLTEGAGDAEPISESAPAEALPTADPRPEPRRLSRGEREVVDRTRQRFSACGRCGYLIADLYLLLGEEAIQTAAIAARDGWLRLEGGDDGLRTLLNGAFGVRLDIAYEAMDGACPECWRRFVFATLDDGRAQLRIRT